MRVIFGLGNPGKDYEQSRHNIGFRVIDKLSQEHRVELNKYSCQAWIGEGEIGKEEVFLVKPLTFVNAAGVSLLQLKQKVIEETISRASQAVEMVIRQGIDETMKLYN